MQRLLFAGDVQAELVRTDHGGAVRSGRRKLEAPSACGDPCTWCSRATGLGSLFSSQHEGAVREALRAMARRFRYPDLRFCQRGDSLHLLVRAKRRVSFQSFLAQLQGSSARRVTGARRGRTDRSIFRRYRLVACRQLGRDYLGVRHYVFRNAIEGALGVRVRRALEEGPRPTTSCTPVAVASGPRIALHGNGTRRKDPITVQADCGGAAANGRCRLRERMR